MQIGQVQDRQRLLAGRQNGDVDAAQDGHPGLDEGVAEHAGAQERRPGERPRGRSQRAHRPVSSSSGARLWDVS